MFSKNTALVKKVTNVHDDDIHGICLVNQNYVVSASKDTSVKLFKLDENITMESLVSKYYGKQPYTSWVTAIDIFEDSSIIVGHRNGYLLCKNVFTDDVYTKNIFAPPQIYNAKNQKKDYYKPRNEQRITGVKTLNSKILPYSGLIGMPEKFYHYDFERNLVLGGYSFNKPEWVYGFSQVNLNRVVVIHAGSLSLFEFKIDDSNSKSSWKLLDRIVDEDMSYNGQRAFISSVFSMEKNIPSTKLALSFFGGATKIVDSETKKVIHSAKEHKDRVWQTVPFSSNEYISCSDDATIKIWDLRLEGKSVSTYDGHPGRVSSIALIRDSFFVAGTCPDNPYDDKEKAQFYFYDVRKTGVVASKRIDNRLQAEEYKKKSEYDEKDLNFIPQYTILKNKNICKKNLFMSDGLNNKNSHQLGWNCFDIAVNLEGFLKIECSDPKVRAEITREKLIEYTLEHSNSNEFLKLLAPEIRHAAALTAIYMNMKEGQENESKKLNEQLIELFSIADALVDKSDKKQVYDKVCELFKQGLSEETEINELTRFVLPSIMHTEELKSLINNYNNAHEAMKESVAICNVDLGHVEGKFISLEQLDTFFNIEENRNQYQEAYLSFISSRSIHLTPFEAKLNEYCSRQDIYKQYVQEYYGKKGWFAFQRNFSEERSTSMVDIVARMLNSQIIICQSQDKNNKEIYHTDKYEEKKIYVQYDGYGHFYAHNQKEEALLKQDEAKNKLMMFSQALVHRQLKKDIEEVRQALHKFCLK